MIFLIKKWIKLRLLNKNEKLYYIIFVDDKGNKFKKLLMNGSERDDIL